MIRVGDMVTSKPVRTWLGANPGCRQVVIDPDGAWNEPTATADLIARADPGALLSAFAEELAPPPQRQWQEAWLAASAAAEAAVDAFLTELGDELCEPRVHRDLGALLPTGSTVFVASSMPIRDLESFLPSNDRDLRFLANRGANGIDGMVSSGLGAAAAGDGHTYLLTGDLGLYHDMNGLLAMRRLGVEATVIVLNNGGGAIFDFLPIARHRDGYEELFGTPTGLDLAKVADLYGTGIHAGRSYADLPGALSRPGLVEIPLDRARNVELHRELFERASAAARAAVRSRQLELQPHGCLGGGGIACRILHRDGEPGAEPLPAAQCAAAASRVFFDMPSERRTRVLAARSHSRSAAGGRGHETRSSRSRARSPSQPRWRSPTGRRDRRGWSPAEPAALPSGASCPSAALHGGRAARRQPGASRAAVLGLVAEAVGVRVGLEPGRDVQPVTRQRGQAACRSIRWRARWSSRRSGPSCRSLR